MIFRPAGVEGVLIVEPQVHDDDRGFFMECFRADLFAAAGITANFVQMNHSRSTGCVLRGLHFQEPRAQGKLMRAIRGAIFDVAVDIRKGSPAFGQWTGVELSEANRLQLWIPPGFAHGFCTLSEVVEVSYLMTEYYAPEAEQLIAWNDPDVAIEWPVLEPTLSARDSAAGKLSEVRALPEYPA
jgi:dTDP-4-dehydrorhamnose 3,5-epimerase